MSTAKPLNRTELIEELDKIPFEYLPALLKILRAFREGVTLPAAEDSFRQGWREGQSGQTRPVEDLWEDIDAA